MTVIEPFRGLRYDPARVDGSDVIAPPYDVVSADDVAALLGQSLYNIAHIESVPGEGDAKYEAAASALRAWEDDGVLRRDDAPAYYAYEQRFAVPGESRQAIRRVFFTRMHISSREAGIVRPHEATLSAAKEDRLRLLKATHTNVSPIFAMFSDPDHSAAMILNTATQKPPAFEARDGRGDEHRLWVIDNPADIEGLTSAVAAAPVTIADGHHRYETALNFLREREAAGGATEAERSLLTGLVPQEDPGLIILPIHRLIRASAIPADFAARLETLYAIEDVGAATEAAASIDGLLHRLRSADPTVPTFGLLGLIPGRMHLLTAQMPHVMEAMPKRLSAASKAIDVLVLNDTVLEPILGLDVAARAAGEHIGFTEDAHKAWHAINRNEYHLAFLVRNVQPEQVVAIADEGELMPQKSTFYYPKLATGMVLNPLD